MKMIKAFRSSWNRVKVVSLSVYVKSVPIVQRSRQCSGNGAIRKKFPLHKPRGEKKLKRHLGTYTKKTYRKPSEQLFPKRRLLSYKNLTNK